MAKTKITDNQISSIDYSLFPAELQKTLYRRNVIINGDMSVNQRTVSSETPASGAGFIYGADRFWYYHDHDAGASAVTVSRETDVPTFAEAGINFTASIKALVNTADTTIAGTNEMTVGYIIEGYDYNQIRGGNATLSFWVKSNKTGTYCVSFRNSGKDRSYIREFTVDASATWEKKTITVPLTETGGTWDYTNGTGLIVSIELMDTAYSATADSWQTGNYINTTNNVNLMDTVGNYFMFTGVQMERGDTATPFEVTTFADQLTRCERYFQKSCEYDVVPYSAATLGRERWQLPTNRADTANFNVSFRFQTVMRDSPTILIYSNVTGTTGYIRDDTTGSDKAVSVANVGKFSYELTNQSGGTINASDIINWHWTADAEL